MALNIPSILPALDRAREQNELSRKLTEKGINDFVKGSGQFAMSYIERQKALKEQEELDRQAQAEAEALNPTYYDFKNDLINIGLHDPFSQNKPLRPEPPYFTGHSIISQRFK